MPSPLVPLVLLVLEPKPDVSLVTTIYKIQYFIDVKLLFVYKYTFHFFFLEPSNDWVLYNVYSSIKKQFKIIHTKVKKLFFSKYIFFFKQIYTFSFYTSRDKRFPEFRVHANNLFTNKLTNLILKQENDTHETSCFFKRNFCLFIWKPKYNYKELIFKCMKVLRRNRK